MRNLSADAVFRTVNNTTMQIYADFSVIETSVGCH